MALEVDTVTARKWNRVAGKETEEEAGGHQQTLTGHWPHDRHCSGQRGYSRGVDREGSCPLG